MTYPLALPHPRIGDRPVPQLNCLLEIVSRQRTPMMRHEQVLTKVWSLRITVRVTFHVLFRRYINTSTEQSLFNVDVEITAFPILDKVVRADPAPSIRRPISSSLPPSA